MLFFCFYTAYETFYRKTCTILIVFVSIFIVGQYYFSLFYPTTLFNNEDTANERYKILDTLSWFSFVPPSNDLWDPYHINNNNDMYFRFVPEILDWFILILMGIIVEFNTLFSDKSKSNRMVNEALVGMSDDWKTLSYYLGRVKRVCEGMFIWIIIIVMCCIQIQMQTNMLNWLFFIVNIVNAVIMISGTRTLRSLKIQEGIATFIKVFSITVIVVDIAFVMFIGEQEKFNKMNSLDQ